MNREARPSPVRASCATNSVSVPASDVGKTPRLKFELMEEPEPGERDRFAKHIRSKEERKQRARNQKGRGILFGMGMFGLVGWAVTIPTLLLLALGIWIDARVESPYSWTLMLLVVGIGLGCLNAWYWVREESQRGT